MGQNSLHIATVVEMFTKHVFVASSEVINFKWCRAQCPEKTPWQMCRIVGEEDGSP